MDRVSEILAYLEAKAAGKDATLPATEGSGDALDRIIEHLVARERRMRHDAQRIEWIGAALVALGAGVPPEPSPGDGLDAIDALSMGVDTLAEALEATTVSLDYLNDVLDSIPDAVFVTTPDGGIHLRNSAAKRMAGHAEHVDQLFPAAPGASAFDAQVGQEVVIPVSVVASTLRAGHRVYVARDISSRLALEQEVERARDEALAASQMKSEFLATMSHEIRTPINGVVGMSQLLSATELRPSQREMAAAISTSATALLEIVNDVLDFSKIEAGRLELEHLEFDLVDTLEQVLEIHALAAASAQDQLFLHVETDVPRVMGDDGRLRQVINNLLANAVKFTRDGEIVIRARAEPKKDGHVVVGIEISDTGIGIAPGQVERLFDAFSQADSSTARKYGGTGLGLAICRQLLELMGGSIAVESALGEGTTFSLSLPLRVSHAAVEPEPSLQAGRVLVVEPSSTGRAILDSHLRRWGARPTLVRYGQAALTQLQLGSFDACIVEQHLPDGSGLALAQRLCAEGRVPTLLVRSVLSRLDRSAVDALGPWGVMAKPLRPRALRRVLGRMLGGQGPAPAEIREGRRFVGRVLVVEDNPINQKVTLAQLQSLGLHADVVGDGAEAVEAFRRLPYDLVLMDVRMPTMDGYEATIRIRALEASTGGRIPIVALTADALTDQRQRVLDVGMDDCITKPATIQALVAVLERWLDAGPAPEPTQEPRPPDADTVLDAAQLEELHALAGDDAEFVSGLFQTFFDVGEQSLGSLRDALARGSATELSQRAHALKGSAGQIGARRVVAACQALEVHARQDRLEAAGSIVEELEVHLADVRQAYARLG
ncbi:MAG: response regulator [Myxococcales bacterium]|nr:response regulator [Myxococcales bacterium]